MKNLLKRVANLKVAIAAAVAVKVLVMAVGSHPFDFATYVYQARSYFEYGINPLFSWNKGMPLLGLFYMQYAVYQAISTIFHAGLESTVLLHIIFKLPFLIFDLLSAYLLYKLVLPQVGKKSTARYLLLLWLFNPFTLWSVELHGSYAIMATFFSLLSLYWLTKRRYVAAMLALAISVSVYYYAIIFVPFYLLKIISENRQRRWFRTAAVSAGAFAASTFVFYAPFLFSGHILLSSFVGSLLNHSAPNASSYAQAVQLPNYSLFKIPYYTAFHQFPTNLSAPFVFKLAEFFTFLGLAFIAAYIGWRLWRYIRTQRYAYDQLFVDLLITTTIFLLCVGQFQDHYLVWIFPYMLLVGVRFSSKHLLRYTYYVGFVAFIGVLGAGNLGIYLLDVVPFGTVNIYAQQNIFGLALGGFTVIVLLVGNFFLSHARTRNLLAWAPEDKIIAAITAVTFAFMGAVSAVVLVSVAHEQGPSLLGGDQNVYNFVYVPAKTAYRGVRTSLAPVAVADSGFEAEPYGPVAPNSALNPAGSPWFFYNYGNSKITAAITENPAHAGSHSLLISPHAIGAAAQLNLGGSSSPGLVPITQNTRYQASLELMAHDLPASAMKASIRFADKRRKIISGSDRVLQTARPDGQWQAAGLRFIPPQGAAYVELLFSVSTMKQTAVAPDASVAVDDYTLQTVRQYSQVSLTQLAPKSNGPAVTTYVLHSSAARYFDYEFSIAQPPAAASVVNVSLGSCARPNDTFNSKPYVVALFNSSCVGRNGTANARLVVSNYPKRPAVMLNLVHELSFTHTVHYHSLVYKLLAAVGAIGDAGLVWYAVRVYRKLGTAL